MQLIAFKNKEGLLGSSHEEQKIVFMKINAWECCIYRGIKDDQKLWRDKRSGF